MIKPYQILARKFDKNYGQVRQIAMLVVPMVMVMLVCVFVTTRDSRVGYVLLNCELQRWRWDFSSQMFVAKLSLEIGVPLAIGRLSQQVRPNTVSRMHTCNALWTLCVLCWPDYPRVLRSCCHA